MLDEERFPGSGRGAGDRLRRREGGAGSRCRENELADFSLPTFDGDEVSVRIRRVRDHALGGIVLSGELEGEPASNVILAEVDGATSGSIRLAKQNLVYEIRPTGEGNISFGEVDLEALGKCALCAEGVSHAETKSEDR